MTSTTDSTMTAPTDTFADTDTDSESVIVTERAVKEFRHVLDEKGLPDETAMRLSVKGGGCSGFEYMIDIERNEPDEFDVVESWHGVQVVIDMKSEFYLNGTTIDFNDGLMDRGFTFQNPQASGTCGCGSSFSV